MPGCWTPPISWRLGWPVTEIPSESTWRKAPLTLPSAGKAIIASRARPSFTLTMSPAVFPPFSVILPSESLVKFQISLASIRSWFRTRASLQVEILTLRHQVAVLKRSQRRRLRLNSADRLLWVWLSCLWSQWRSMLLMVKPETVIAWHRKGFRLYWTWKSRCGTPGRPEVCEEVRQLIRKMSMANSRWGAPRIHGELLKLGIQVSQATVAKYMVRLPKPSSQTWRTFLKNHVKDLVATDFFVVPTLSFRVLFVFVALAHHRRRILHFNVTAHPTSDWTAQQIAEAFPWDSAPPY